MAIKYWQIFCSSVAAAKGVESAAYDNFDRFIKTFYSIIVIGKMAQGVESRMIVT